MIDVRIPRRLPLMTLIGGALLLAALAGAAGCGSSKQGAPVSGTVTLDGKPVPIGTVRFIGAEPGLQPVNANIKDGKYELTAEDGLKPGKYKVQLSWLKKTGRKINPSEIGDPEYAVDETVEQFTEKYNAKTTLEVVIKSEPNTHNFDVKR